jgi:hypothetical protein
MRDDEATVRWLYVHDPYAGLLTRADYRARFGILPIGEEERPPRRPTTKVAGKVVREPCEPWLKAPTLHGPHQRDERDRELPPGDFRLACRCTRCRALGSQRAEQVRHDRQGLLVANPYRATHKGRRGSARILPRPARSPATTAWPAEWRDQWRELTVAIQQAEYVAFGDGEMGAG